MSLNVFIKDNLIAGYQNKSFSKEQVNIFSLNYLDKGTITQADFDEIQVVVDPIEVGEVIE